MLLRTTMNRLTLRASFRTLRTFARAFSAPKSGLGASGFARGAQVQVGQNERKDSVPFPVSLRDETDQWWHEPDPTPTSSDCFASFKIPLGAAVLDPVSSVRGIVTSRTQFLNGCNRYGIERGLDRDGKPLESWFVDEDRLVLLRDKPNFIRMGRKVGGVAERGGPVTRSAPSGSSL